MVAPARDVAVRVVHRVLHDDAWAARALDAELARAVTEPADAALATQIIYGTLRVLPTLDAQVSRYARRQSKIDAWTRASIVTAAFQLLHLSRVPPHAAVDDAVALVLRKRGKRVAGFANAVLRKIAETRPLNPTLPGQLIVPSWLRVELGRSIGDERTEALLRIASEAPSTDVRVRRGFVLEEVASSIRHERPTAGVARTALSPIGLRVTGGGDLRQRSAYQDGRMAMQEEGAQVIGLLVGASPGDRILDACAGRGGKTTQLIEAVGPNGSVVAADLHRHRLDQIPIELQRLRLDPAACELVSVDWTVGRGKVQGPFDHIVVDAPCTGLGTLRRRPEILLRIGPKDAARMGELQRQILSRVAPMVRPGGRLVYAVCSPLRKEGSEVTQVLSGSGFRQVNWRPFDLKSLPFGSNAPLDLGPWVRGSGPWADAYQVSVWVNVG